MKNQKEGGETPLMNMSHDSSITHVTGRSEYIDDRRRVAGEVYVDFYGSPSAHGKIISIDYTKALSRPGIYGIWSASDLGENSWGPVIEDQPILAKSIVQYSHEPILILAGESIQCLKDAKKEISVVIEELPKIFTIEDALESENYLSELHKIGNKRDVEKTFQTSKSLFLEGEFYSEGQEHFYFETQSSIAYPTDSGGIELHSSSQHPTEIQHVVAKILGLSMQDIVCVVKRLGGGFGGKESQATLFAVMAAFVAFKLKRAARIVLDRDDDMKVTGKRHPFKSNYKVAFTPEGEIEALSAELFSDGGAYLDLSVAILYRALFHLDNAYFLKHAYFEGRVCKTNLPPNTAFRGFGGPQGMAIIEFIIEEIASFLNVDPLEIRLKNIYRDGANKGEDQKTPYGQVIKKSNFEELFNLALTEGKYFERKEEIENFNNEHSSLVLRGLSLTPIKFGISFTATFLNQGSALINIYYDGTIQVSTGAIEMGQGVFVKIKRVVCEVFGVSPRYVRVMPTSTEKNPNTSATAASSGADINCSATLNAALQLKERLLKVACNHFKEELQEEIIFSEGFVYRNGDKRNKKKWFAFSDLVHKAYFSRVNLSAQGFYQTKNIHFNYDTGKGEPFLYFTQGVALSEVEVDSLTGQVKLLKANLFMDLGRPLNLPVDKGQVAGAFIQGAGWITTESLFYSPKGELLSCSPTTYKIPAVTCTPNEFSIQFLHQSNNESNIYGSKAVGEPPFPLALSVLMAIREAIKFKIKNESRSSSNPFPESIPLKIPMVAENILDLLKS